MSRKWLFRAVVAALPCFALAFIEGIGHTAAHLGDRIGRWVDAAQQEADHG